MPKNCQSSGVNMPGPFMMLKQVNIIKRYNPSMNIACKCVVL